MCVPVHRKHGDRLTAESTVVTESQGEIQPAVSEKLQQAVALPDDDFELHFWVRRREQRQRLRQPAIRKVLGNTQANFSMKPRTTDGQNSLVIQCQHPSRKADQLFARLGQLLTSANFAKQWFSQAFFQRSQLKTDGGWR